jgi:hypothetical protein
MTEVAEFVAKWAGSSDVADECVDIVVRLWSSGKACDALKLCKRAMDILTSTSRSNIRELFSNALAVASWSWRVPWTKEPQYNITADIQEVATKADALLNSITKTPQGEPENEEDSRDLHDEIQAFHDLVYYLYTVVAMSARSCINDTKNEAIEMSLCSMLCYSMQACTMPIRHSNESAIQELSTTITMFSAARSDPMTAGWLDTTKLEHASEGYITAMSIAMRAESLVPGRASSIAEYWLLPIVSLNLRNTALIDWTTATERVCEVLMAPRGSELSEAASTIAAAVASVVADAVCWGLREPIYVSRRLTVAALNLLTKAAHQSSCNVAGSLLDAVAVVVDAITDGRGSSRDLAWCAKVLANALKEVIPSAKGVALRAARNQPACGSSRGARWVDAIASCTSFSSTMELITARIHEINDQTTSSSSPIMELAHILAGGDNPGQCRYPAIALFDDGNAHAIFMSAAIQCATESEFTKVVCGGGWASRDSLSLIHGLCSCNVDCPVWKGIFNTLSYRLGRVLPWASIATGLGIGHASHIWKCSKLTNKYIDMQPRDGGGVVPKLTNMFGQAVTSMRMAFTPNGHQHTVECAIATLAKQRASLLLLDTSQYCDAISSAISGYLAVLTKVLSADIPALIISLSGPYDDLHDALSCSALLYLAAIVNHNNTRTAVLDQPIIALLETCSANISRTLPHNISVWCMQATTAASVLMHSNALHIPGLAATLIDPSNAWRNGLCTKASSTPGASTLIWQLWTAICCGCKVPHPYVSTLQCGTTHTAETLSDVDTSALASIIIQCLVSDVGMIDLAYTTLERLPQPFSLLGRLAMVTKCSRFFQENSSTSFSDTIPHTIFSRTLTTSDITNAAKCNDGPCGPCGWMRLQAIAACAIADMQGWCSDEGLGSRGSPTMALVDVLFGKETAAYARAKDPELTLRTIASVAHTYVTHKGPLHSDLILRHLVSKMSTQIEVSPQEDQLQMITSIIHLAANSSTSTTSLTSINIV